MKQFVSEFGDELDAIPILGEKSGETFRFVMRGKRNAILHSLPENTKVKLLTITEYQYKHICLGLSCKYTFVYLQRCECEGGHLVAVIKNINEVYLSLVRKMYRHKVTARVIRRNLSADERKMLDLLNKEVSPEDHYVSSDLYKGYDTDGSIGFTSETKAKRALMERVKHYRSLLRRKLAKDEYFDHKEYSYEDGVSLYVNRATEERRRIEQKQRKFDREQRLIVKHYDSPVRSVGDVLYKSIRTGMNTGGFTGRISTQNGIECYEYKDRDGYARSYGHSMTRRSFAINIKKGWRMRTVGGILTFYRGKFDRQGMKVEWVEQGRAISNLTTRSGYLVRGEHIEVKSLREAKRINGEHRAVELARLLASRKRTERKRE